MAGRSYDVITFDCYGTLIDWEQGMRSAFAAARAHDHATASVRALVNAYHAAERQLEAGAYRPYRAVLADCAQRAALAKGWAMSDVAAEAFAASVPTWPPFVDTNPALERLAAAGYRLGILSNVDDDLLAGTRRNFTVEFELIVTAQQVRSYKPAHAHFETARQRIGGALWLHAAQSYFHDIAPCAALGVPAAWINRTHEQAGGAARPLRELGTLADLADWLAP